MSDYDKLVLQSTKSILGGSFDQWARTVIELEGEYREGRIFVRDLRVLSPKLNPSYFEEGHDIVLNGHLSD